MKRALFTALGVASLFVAAPALAVNVTPTPDNDPCSYAFVNGAIACQGYYGGNLITGSTGSATTLQQQSIINLLLTGTPSTSDNLPTTNGPTYTGNYVGLNYNTVLSSLANLNGTSTLTFSNITLSGLTILGAHFGNNIDSDPNNVTAFWLINATDPHTITLTSGQGSSNAQIFATGGRAVPEPATWAMMLVGFGSIGAAMRRSRRRQSALMQIA